MSKLPYDCVTAGEANSSVSPYLLLPRRTVGQACRDAGRDNCGKRCRGCCLGDLCLRPEPVR
jgi:hypothetical protein